jgi:hypothetical protein
MGKRIYCWIAILFLVFFIIVFGVVLFPIITLPCIFYLNTSYDKAKEGVKDFYKELFSSIRYYYRLERF